MKSLKLLEGKTLDLRSLNAREQAFLKDLRKMSREGVSYFEVYRTALGPGSPALGGRNRIDRKTADSPLYLAARDIATRAGIKQGLVLAPDQEQARPKASRDSSMISVAQAAKLIGISRAAVYKAIEKNSLAAERIGNVTLVDRAAATAYRDDRENPSGARTGRGTRGGRFAGEPLSP